MTRPDKAAVPIPDLVDRNFIAEAIRQKGCSNSTEIPADEDKLYPAIVEDLAMGHLRGIAIGEHHDAPLLKAALFVAAALCGGQVSGVLFHSDKGGEG